MLVMKPSLLLGPENTNGRNHPEICQPNEKKTDILSLVIFGNKSSRLSLSSWLTKPASLPLVGLSASKRWISAAIKSLDLWRLDLPKQFCISVL
jgi:hypothetical protein